MAVETQTTGGLIDALNGSHLHWSDFRDNVLQPFRIRSSTSHKVEQLPTTFLARLQAFQGNHSKYDKQRQAWRLDEISGRGLGPTSIFPPNLLPPVPGSSNILRCISPRMSREALPLRTPSEKHSLYELPTTKPAYVCGFDIEMFEKTEQAYLGGPLVATGTLINFSTAEVLPGRTVCSPFLAFERFEANSERHVETARNACAVTGAQCLRAQQQLFHKAFGLQTISQPPITFTCALNNEHAVINCHYVDEDGNYTMAALCKFDLRTDDHFNTFQAWIEAIESWALLYLLPRVKGALGEVMRSNPSPPPSPAPTATSHLSIDTKSETAVTILKTLRRLWPMIPWRNDVVGETPINSSIAQCGTPLPTRQIRTMSLPSPAPLMSSTSSDSSGPIRPSSSMSQRMSGMLTPLHTDIPQSARPKSRQSIHARRFSCARSACGSDRSMTPESPCRPPSLSPCTPGPEAPVSSRSPMLVLQKRLEVAMSEIEELRGQVDGLQGQLNGRTETLERRLEILTERQAETEQFLDGNKGWKKAGGGWVKQLEALVEEEIITPIVGAMWENAEEPCEECGSPICGSPLSAISPTIVAMGVPGFFPPTSAEDAQLWKQPVLTEELVVYCLALVMRDEKTNLGAMMLGGLAMCYSGLVDSSGCLANMAMMFALDTYVKQALFQVCSRLSLLYEAAQAYDLEMNTKREGNLGLEKIIEVSEEEAARTTTDEFEEADVPLLLA